MKFNFPQFQFHGISVAGLSKAQLLDALSSVIDRMYSESGRPVIIANHNLHSLYLFHTQRKMRDFYRLSSFNFVDGMPIIWLARAAGYPLQKDHRHTYLNWFNEALARGERANWRFFFLGGSSAMIADANQILRRNYPHLIFKTHHGYFDQDPKSTENQSVLNLIRDFRPDVLVEGMGMPRQEIWLSENISELNAKVALNAGAALDYIAGHAYAPPRWSGKLGLEWAFRLAANPRRLWQRYLLEPFLLAWILVKKKGVPYHD